MSLKNLTRTDIIILCISILLLATSIFYFRQARHWIDQDFPGFLTLENQVVGAFNQFEWDATQMGLKYHDYVHQRTGADQYKIIQDGESAILTLARQPFTLGDFLKVFCLPFFSGFLFLILAVVIYWVMRGQSGALPFYLFNAGIGYYLMSSFDFHADHHASWLFLINFSLMPAYMTTFALVYPERPAFIAKRGWLLAIPFLISLTLDIPYVFTFYNDPLRWPFWESLVIGYAACSYLFWILRLGQIANSPQQELNRVVAKYLLVGQLLAFIVPLVVAIQIFVFKHHMPLNLAAPVNLVFPIAALFGMTLGKLKQTQMELIQSEKMASLGQLLAGVAHEINNPTTFIYSNLKPLKEYLNYLKKVVRKEAPKYREEMSADEVLSDLDSLVSNVEEGASRTKQIVSDLRRFGHSQEDVVSDVSVMENIQSTLNILKHSWSDRIQIHVDCDPQLSLRVNAGQLSQALMNLLNNSIHSIEKEGEIWIKASVDQGRFILSIRDTGCGMTASQIKKIFDPFYTTKEQGQGTGLGLSIVQQIVKKWRGEIQVRSEIGKGSEFIVSLRT